MQAINLRPMSERPEEERMVAVFCKGWLVDKVTSIHYYTPPIPDSRWQLLIKKNESFIGWLYADELNFTVRGE